MIKKSTPLDASIELLIVEIKWLPETFILNKIKKLVEAGVHVSIATTIPPKNGHQMRIDGVKFYRLPHWQDSISLRMFQLLYFGFSLLFEGTTGREKTRYFLTQAKVLPIKEKFNFLLRSMILARMKPSVVHFEWNSAAVNYQYMFPVWGAPIVISCRGSQINVRPHVSENKMFVEGVKETFDKATAVHCVSAEIKEEATKLGLDPIKARVIKPAVDPEFFCPSEKRDVPVNIFRIVSVGSLSWIKGYEYALLSIKQLVKLGVEVSYKIIGDGPEHQRVLYTIQDLVLQNNVHLCGNLSSNDVRDSLQVSDVFLLPSLSEGISNAALEAMACGIPVVTTNCGGMQEAVKNGVNGFVVPVRDVASMVHALYSLWENPDMRWKMGAAGREKVLREFSLDQQKDKFITLYQDVILALKKANAKFV